MDLIFLYFCRFVPQYHHTRYDNMNCPQLLYDSRRIREKIYRNLIMRFIGRTHPA